MNSLNMCSAQLSAATTIKKKFLIYWAVGCGIVFDATHYIVEDSNLRFIIPQTTAYAM